MTENERPLIVATGRFEADRRRFRFRRAPLELPDLEHGQRLILIDYAGEAVVADSSTGGERAFSRFASWVVVDVGGRDLHFEYDDLFSTSYARYIVAIDLHAELGSGRELAVAGISSLESYSRPKVAAMAKQALRKHEIPLERVADPVAQIRAVGEDWLHDALVGVPVPNLPGWLTLTVTHLVVRNDTAAETHSVVLRSERNKKDLLIAQGINGLTGTKFDIKKSQLLRDALAPHMTSSSAATLEAVWQNPTPDNFAAAAASIRAVEANEQGYFLAVLEEIRKSDSFMDADGLIRVVRKVLDFGKEETLTAISVAEQPASGLAGDGNGPAGEVLGGDRRPTGEPAGVTGIDPDDADFSSR